MKMFNDLQIPPRDHFLQLLSTGSSSALLPRTFCSRSPAWRRKIIRSFVCFVSYFLPWIISWEIGQVNPWSKFPKESKESKRSLSWSSKPSRAARYIWKQKPDIFESKHDTKSRQKITKQITKSPSSCVLYSYLPPWRLHLSSDPQTIETGDQVGCRHTWTFFYWKVLDRAWTLDLDFKF